MQSCQHRVTDTQPSEGQFAARCHSRDRATARGHPASKTPATRMAAAAAASSGHGEKAAEGSLSADARFDITVGALEDAIMVPEFRERVDNFCNDNCGSFGAPEDDSGEGYKLEWTDLFHQYTAIIESHIEAALVAAVPDFDMEWFMGELESRGDSGAIDGEVFDLLLSLGDFEDFVSLMRCHKQEQDALSAAASGEAPAAGRLAATAALGLAPVVSRAPAESAAAGAAEASTPQDPPEAAADAGVAMEAAVDPAGAETEVAEAVPVPADDTAPVHAE